jgi:2-haloacid dehalogenase
VVDPAGGKREHDRRQRHAEQAQDGSSGHAAEFSRLSALLRRTAIGEDGAMQTIEAVVFDIGGVLLDWNPRYLYRQLFDDEDSMERFLAEVCTLEWHTAHDLGVPYAQSCAALAQRHPEQADLIWAWGRRSEEMIGGPITGTVEILCELLAAGLPCYALTNMEAETYPLRRDRYDFMSWFEGTVVSSHERVAKPDPEIFHRLLDRFGLRAETTLLIDDSQRNVEAARELGMPAIRFESPAQVRRYLEQTRVLTPA